MNKTSILLLLFAAGGLGYAARDHAPAPVAQVQATAPAEPEGGEYSPPQQVSWVSEAEAKASGKNILYFVTRTKGCEPCRRTKEMFGNPMSVEAMSRFACVLIEDQPSTHPWMRHYGIKTVPTMVFVGPAGTQPRVQTGAPSSVPAFLQFLQFMEDRFAGKPAPVIVADSSKISIDNPPKPTLAPASHDTAAPFLNKGRSSVKQERSCVKVFQRNGRCYRRSCGAISGGCKSCR